MFKLLRNVRKAYKQWRALPGEERQRYSAEMRRIMTLVRELGGAKAVQFVDGSADSLRSAEEESTASTEKRSRSVVMADLQKATGSLLAALASPAADLAMNSIPRSARVGGKLARRGIRRHMRGRE
jgi:hypothetical protein